jgi:hypothetical protein
VYRPVPVTFSTPSARIVSFPSTALIPDLPRSTPVCGGSYPA